MQHPPLHADSSRRGLAVRDLHTLGSRKFTICGDVVFVRIDHRALAETPAAEKIGCATRLVVVKRLEYHAWEPSPPVATRQPRARHSMTPCSMRCARNPLVRSSSTASTAMTQYGPRQYATMSRLLGRACARLLSSASGTDSAPGMWPAWYSSLGRTSRTTTSLR